MGIILIVLLLLLLLLLMCAIRSHAQWAIQGKSKGRLALCSSVVRIAICSFARAQASLFEIRTTYF